MTKDDIIRMAQDAGMTPISHVSTADVICSRTSLERFAALVAAAEREACAKMAENRWLDKANCTAEEMYEMQKKSIADAIRARGKNGSLVVHPSDDDWYYANKLKANND